MWTTARLPPTRCRRRPAARRPGRGRACDPRAAAAGERPPRRPRRAGARRRDGHRARAARGGVLACAHDRDDGRGREAPRGEGLGGAGRREPDGERAERRRLRGVADPGDARAHEPRLVGAGRRGEHRDGHPRQARRAPGGARRAGGAGVSAEGTTSTEFATIEEALEDLRAGRMVVVVDDENRENEGDLTLAAQFATPEAINFMAKEGRGRICLALTPERCEELGLDLMAAKNETPDATAFSVSVKARD